MIRSHTEPSWIRLVSWPQRAPCLFRCVRTQWENGRLWIRTNRPSSNIESAGLLVWNFWPSRSVRNRCLLFKPSSLCYVGIASSLNGLRHLKLSILSTVDDSTHCASCPYLSFKVKFKYHLHSVWLNFPSPGEEGSIRWCKFLPDWKPTESRFNGILQAWH